MVSGVGMSIDESQCFWKLPRVGDLLLLPKSVPDHHRRLSTAAPQCFAALESHEHDVLRIDHSLATLTHSALTN